jgi:hypothetical protein
MRSLRNRQRLPGTIPPPCKTVPRCNRLPTALYPKPDPAESILASRKEGTLFRAPVSASVRPLFPGFITTRGSSFVEHFRASQRSQQNVRRPPYAISSVVATEGVAPLPQRGGLESQRNISDNLTVIIPL